MKNKEVYKVGSFKDFTGTERQVVFCAISIVEEGDLVTDTCVSESNKTLLLGLSVQGPFDLEKENFELGRTIAKGKALKEKSRIGIIVSSEVGFINHSVVGALLEQELEFFKNNPGKYIKGYNKDKELYENNSKNYYDKYKIS